MIRVVIAGMWICTTKVGGIKYINTWGLCPVLVGTSADPPCTLRSMPGSNKGCKDAGVLRVPLYQATRHSFVCQMLNSGIDKSMVQRLLRHTDPKITDRYAEYSTNALRVKLDNVFRINRQETVRKAKKAETSG